MAAGEEGLVNSWRFPVDLGGQPSPIDYQSLCSGVDASAGGGEARHCLWILTSGQQQRTAVRLALGSRSSRCPCSFQRTLVVPYRTNSLFPRSPTERRQSHPTQPSPSHLSPASFWKLGKKRPGREISEKPPMVSW